MAQSDQHMQIYFHGNCQARAIAQMIGPLYADWNISFREVFQQKIVSEIDEYYSIVRNADIIVAQPIQDGYRNRSDLSLSWVRSAMKPGARLVVFPSMYFGGQLIGCATLGGPAYLMEYHDIMLLKLAALGLDTCSITAALLSDELYSKDFVRSEINFATNEIVRREDAEQVDVRLSPFLNKYAHSRQLFHVINHPCRPALAYVANEILDALGCARSVQSHGSDYIAFPHVPCPPSVLDYFEGNDKPDLAWPSEDQERYHVPAGSMPRDEYIGQAVEYITSRPHEDVQAWLGDPRSVAFLQRVEAASPGMFATDFAAYRPSPRYCVAVRPDPDRGPANPPEETAFLTRFRDLFASNRSKAEAMLQHAVNQDYNTAAIHAAFARAWLILERNQHAKTHYEKAAVLLPQDADILQLGSSIALLEDRLSDAATLLARASVAAPTDTAVLNRLSLIQDRTGDLMGAEITLRRLLILEPNNQHQLTELGTNLARQFRFEEALNFYNAALVIEPRSPGANFGASLILAKIKRRQDAIDAVQIAIAERGKVALYHSHLAHLLVAEGRTAEAIESVERALSLEPDNQGLIGMQLQLLQLEGRHDEALEHLSRSADHIEGNPDLLVSFGRHLASLNRTMEAVSAYRRAVSCLPGRVAWHLECGTVLAQMGRWEEAAAELQVAWQIDRTDVGIIVKLSEALEHTGNARAARQQVEEGLAAKPSEPTLQALLAKLDDLAAGRRIALVEPRFLAVEIVEIAPSAVTSVPACLAYTNFLDINPSFGAQHIKALYVAKQRWSPAVELCRLPTHTRLYSWDAEEMLPVVETDGGAAVVSEQVRRDWTDLRVTEAVADCPSTVEIEGQVVVVGRYGVRTWGHWLGELLPKVVAVEARFPGRFRFLVPERMTTDPVHRTALQSLDYYGISPDRLVLAAPRTCYTCADLHVVTSTWSAERAFHPAIATLMRRQATGQAEPNKGWLRVALLRRGGRNRTIGNLVEVEALLAGRGYQVVDIETLDFAQQADLFRNATAVVSVLGSSLSGLFYCPKGLKLVTLAPGDWGDSFFYSMMQERGVTLADVRGLRPSGATSFSVPIESLSEACDAVSA